MPSALKFIDGGLLQGLGQGLMKEGEAKRKRAHLRWAKRGPGCFPVLVPVQCV